MTHSLYRILAIGVTLALCATVVFGLCAMAADAMNGHDAQCVGSGFALMLCESTVIRANLHLLLFEGLTLALLLFGASVVFAQFPPQSSKIPLWYEYRRTETPLTGIRYALARGILQPKVFAAHR